MRRLTLLLGTTAALMLTACSDEKAGGPQTKADIASEAGETVEIKPGQYESSVEFTRFDIPGMPPEVVAQMRSGMESAMAVKQSYCLTAAEAAQGREGRLRELTRADGDCTMENYEVDGEDVTGRLVCRAADGATSTMAFNGTMGAESSNMTLNVEMASPANPGQKATIAMRASSRRTGDCTAADAAAAPAP